MLNAVTPMTPSLCTAALCLALALPAVPAMAEPLELTASAVPFDATDPERDRAGKLVWRGGIEITSPNPRFGGLSGLLVSGDRIGFRSLAIGLGVDGSWSCGWPEDDRHDRI